MTVFANPQTKKRFARVAQQRLNRWSTSMMRAVGAPSGNDLIRPSRPIAQCCVVVWPNRFCYFAHLERIGVAPCKDVRHLKRAKPQRPRTAFAAFDRWVVVYLGRLRGVQHHKQHPLAARVPGPGQGVAVPFTVRISCGGRRIVFDMRPGDHLDNKYAGRLQFTAAIGAHSDSFAFIRGPDLFTKRDLACND